MNSKSLNGLMKLAEHAVKSARALVAKAELLGMDVPKPKRRKPRADAGKPRGSRTPAPKPPRTRTPRSNPATALGEE